MDDLDPLSYSDKALLLSFRAQRELGIMPTGKKAAKIQELLIRERRIKRKLECFYQKNKLANG